MDERQEAQEPTERQEEETGLGTEMRTKDGFYRAQAHERTTDLTMLDKIVY